MKDIVRTELNKAIKYYKDNGLLKFARRVLNRLGFVQYNRNLIFVHLNLDNIVDALNEPYAFHLATIEDVKKEENYFDNLFTKEEAIKRIKNGHRLFVFKLNDKIVYYRWIEYKKVKINWFDIEFEIPPAFVYSTGLYTAPELRRTGLAYRLTKQINHFLKNEGVRNLFAVVNPENSAAIKYQKKIGVKDYQFVNYKRYWFLRYYKVKKINSYKQKVFISIFSLHNSDLWKCFLNPSNKTY